MATATHQFAARLTWNDPSGAGTADYEDYSREYRVEVEGKPDLVGTAASQFRGDPALPNPEDMFVTAIAACHMLTYLAIAAKSRITVISYRDAAVGTLAVGGPDGDRFTEVVLHPEVVIAAGSDPERAMKIHDSAHRHCFIANSSSAPIRHEATVRVAGAVG